MCTLIILRRPEHAWPLLLAGNRDEMRDRPWSPPARHWDDRPETVAGIDRLAGGSWMGVNDHGMAAVVMNRTGTLGPAAGKRSRGELVLEALDHSQASAAAEAMSALNPRAYRAFNLVVADPGNCFLISNTGDNIATAEIPAGLQMLAAGDLNDTGNPRIRAFLPRFSAATVPDPSDGNWHHWQQLLADADYRPDGHPSDAMCFQLENGFGTRSSSLIALPRYPGWGVPPVWLFAGGPPDASDFLPVTV